MLLFDPQGAAITVRYRQDAPAIDAAATNVVRLHAFPTGFAALCTADGTGTGEDDFYVAVGVRIQRHDLSFLPGYARLG